MRDDSFDSTLKNDAPIAPDPRVKALSSLISIGAGVPMQPENIISTLNNQNMKNGIPSDVLQKLNEEWTEKGKSKEIIWKVTVALRPFWEGVYEPAIIRTKKGKTTDAYPGFPTRMMTELDNEHDAKKQKIRIGERNFLKQSHEQKRTNAILREEVHKLTTKFSEVENEIKNNPDLSNEIAFKRYHAELSYIRGIDKLDFANLPSDGLRRIDLSPVSEEVLTRTALTYPFASSVGKVGLLLKYSLNQQCPVRSTPLIEVVDPIDIGQLAQNALFLQNVKKEFFIQTSPFVGSNIAGKSDTEDYRKVHALLVDTISTYWSVGDTPLTLSRVGDLTASVLTKLNIPNPDSYRNEMSTRITRMFQTHLEKSIEKEKQLKLELVAEVTKIEKLQEAEILTLSQNEMIEYKGLPKRKDNCTSAIQQATTNIASREEELAALTTHQADIDTRLSLDSMENSGRKGSLLLLSYTLLTIIQERRIQEITNDLFTYFSDNDLSKPSKPNIQFILEAGEYISELKKERGIIDKKLKDAEADTSAFVNTVSSTCNDANTAKNFGEIQQSTMDLINGFMDEMTQKHPQLLSSLYAQERTLICNCISASLNKSCITDEIALEQLAALSKENASIKENLQATGQESDTFFNAIVTVIDRTKKLAIENKSLKKTVKTLSDYLDHAKMLLSNIHPSELARITGQKSSSDFIESKQDSEKRERKSRSSRTEHSDNTSANPDSETRERKSRSSRTEHSDNTSANPDSETRERKSRSSRTEHSDNTSTKPDSEKKERKSRSSRTENIDTKPRATSPSERSFTTILHSERAMSSSINR